MMMTSKGMLISVMIAVRTKLERRLLPIFALKEHCGVAVASQVHIVSIWSRLNVLTHWDCVV